MAHKMMVYKSTKMEKIDGTGIVSRNFSTKINVVIYINCTLEKITKLSFLKNAYIDSNLQKIHVINPMQDINYVQSRLFHRI